MRERPGSGPRAPQSVMLQLLCTAAPVALMMSRKATPGSRAGHRAKTQTQPRGSVCLNAADLAGVAYAPALGGQARASEVGILARSPKLFDA
jgi:hypothetical protein